MTRSLRAGLLAALAVLLPSTPAAIAADPTPQTISFAAPSDVAVGRELALVASASSGLVVTFASRTPAICAVSGTTLTPIAVGECTIVANQVGDLRYAPADPITVSFPVGASVGYLSLRQQFLIGGEERLSVPIYVPRRTIVEMRLITDPVLPGQVVEVWRQIGTGPWRKLTTRAIETDSGAARYTFKAYQRNVAYRWRFPGTETYGAGWSAARRIYAR